MAVIVVDTDVASRLLRDDLPEQRQSLLVGSVLAVTFVTVGEMFKGAIKARWGQTRVAQIEAWLTRAPVLPYDESVARAWGEVMARAELRRPARPLPSNDAWIAACCLAAEVPLMTLNRRHFEMIDGLTLL